MEYIKITKENIDLEHKHTAASMTKKRNKNRQFREETVCRIAIQDYYVITRHDRAIYIYFVIVRATRKPQALEMSYVPANIR